MKKTGRHTTFLSSKKRLVFQSIGLKIAVFPKIFPPPLGIYVAAAETFI
ncbi:MAG TPA: hypothetical protein VGB68_14940 [Pyrinomonadaceae bacterium]|jgi:cytochrome bd-type quinol oxidase subunit 2